jgi:NAD(P)-dependent dehydrogenase (short-subunit alcohol dehydrogenase family)
MYNPMDLTGHKIMITGASSGIGRETAVMLSRLGATLVLCGRNEERLKAVADRLEPAEHALEFYDFHDLDGIGEWLKGVVQRNGPLDGLVHSAGIPAMIPLRTLRIDQIRETLDVNLASAIVLAKAFRIRTNHKPKSSLVLLSSSAGLTGEVATSAYAASKGGIVGLTRALAMELVKEGIRVNCVAPGFVKSELFDLYSERVTPEHLAEAEASFPLGFGEPLDIAYAIAYLLAETGRWITGTILPVDGGYLAT